MKYPGAKVELLIILYIQCVQNKMMYIEILGTIGHTTACKLKKKMRTSIAKKDRALLYFKSIPLSKCRVKNENIVFFNHNIFLIIGDPILKFGG